MSVKLDSFFEPMRGYFFCVLTKQDKKITLIADVLTRSIYCGVVFYCLYKLLKKKSITKIIPVSGPYTLKIEDKIPQISGWGFSSDQVEKCKNLFREIYQKKFFDTHTDVETDKIIEEFIKLNRRNLDPVMVSIDSTVIVNEKGCFFNTQKTSFGSNHMLSFSPKFLDEYSKTNSENENQIRRVIKEMKKAVEELYQTQKIK